MKITLGSYPALTLAKARLKRGELESMLVEGLDPIEQLAINEAKRTNAYTLVNVTNEWLDVYAVKKPLSDESKHKRLRKFENHLFSKLNDISIDQVKLRDLKDALNEIYVASPDNAQRIRADLILIFSYAVQHNYIEINIARELEDMDLSAKKSHRATFELLVRYHSLYGVLKLIRGIH